MAVPFFVHCSQFLPSENNNHENICSLINKSKNDLDLNIDKPYRTMKKYCLLPLAAAAAASGCSGSQDHELPNVIIILADDLGCGDVSCLGSTVLKTPGLDRLCSEGLNLLNGHSAAPTSTPSRYSLMTGLYPWRNADAEILSGDANLLIDEDQPTIARMMQEAGYSTAAIGKWHLGLGKGKIDWNTEITPNPTSIGFDYSYIIAATVDRVPTVYVENGNVVGLNKDNPLYVSYVENFPGEPTALTHPEMLKMKWSDGHNCSIVNGIPRIGYQKGGNEAYWDDETMADVFLAKVKDYIDENKDRPFFLYYGLHQPHVPRTPHPRFVGSSGMGPRGDAIVEADWCVNELLDYLDEKGLSENTIVIFTSDNGPVLDDGYQDQAAEKWGDLTPALPYRGGKYSLYDGGTHVPFFVRWKGHIAPGSSTDALVCQMDLFASLAGLIGCTVPEGLDSRNAIDTFLGKDTLGREGMVLGSEGRLTYRTRDWHLIPPYEGPERNTPNIELGNSPSWALYHLSEDIHEDRNLSGKCTEKEELMRDSLNSPTSGYFSF